MNGEEYYEQYDPLALFGLKKSNDPDDCGKCQLCLGKYKHKDFPSLPITASLMVLCQVCGNKRCPKATDHHLDCTGSNEPGQEGSVYV